jgi:HEAT repeat protein
LKDPRAQEVLVSALKSSEVVIQQAAIAAIGEIGAVDAVEEILAFAQAEDWLVRQRLAEALAHLPSPKTEPALRYLEKDAHPQVAAAARISLQRLQDAAA